MPKKSTLPTRDGPRCKYGHDWRISFDSRFYYCYACPAEWRSKDGSPPPQQSYKQYPDYPEYTNYYLEQGANSNIMANTQSAQRALTETTDNDTASAYSDQEAQWKSPEELLYQRILVTRANVVDKYDARYDKNRTFAYVNFVFADDETATPFVFRTGWPVIRKQINALNALKAQGDDPYPVECGLAEILTKNPLTGDDGTVRFPLHLLPFEELDQAETDATSYSLKSQPQPATSASPPDVKPARTPTAASSTPRGATTAATAGKRSVTSTPVTPPSSLRGRGN